MPLVGPRTELREPWGRALRAVLAEEGVSQADLRIPGLRRPAFDEHPRRLVVETRGFELGPMEADEVSGGKRVKRLVKFGLPPGAFATVVLRALGQ
jgi:tRNA pseudouridine13 synthase